MEITRAKAESWAQAVEEEMRRNGYTRLAAFLPANRMRIMFSKGTLRGTAEGDASDYSTLIVRAAIDAYEKEEAENILKENI